MVKVWAWEFFSVKASHRELFCIIFGGQSVGVGDFREPSLYSE